MELLRTLMSRGDTLAALVLTAFLGAAASPAAHAHNFNDQPLQAAPDNALTPQQAADVMSIRNVWNAYAMSIDTSAGQQLADLFTPYGTIFNYKDTQNMEPGGCGPQYVADPLGPDPTPACVPDAGCVSSGHLSLVMKWGGRDLDRGRGYSTGRHTISNQLVHLDPDGRHATLYAYIFTGRYINDFVKTDQGWKVQYQRVIWAVPSNAGCLASTDIQQVLGEDIARFENTVRGPQLPVEVLDDPVLARVGGYIEDVLDQLNRGDRATPCLTMTNLQAYADAQESNLQATMVDPWSQFAPRTRAETIRYWTTRFKRDNSCA